MATKKNHERTVSKTSPTYRSNSGVKVDNKTFMIIIITIIIITIITIIIIKKWWCGGYIVKNLSKEYIQKWTCN